MSYYRKKVYDSHNGDSGLNARTGQVVEVLRELTDREADIADVGRMFHGQQDGRVHCLAR